MSARIVFCPKCHQEAFRIVVDENGSKIMQGRNTIINMGKGGLMGNSKSSVSCPKGHSVRIELGDSKEGI